MEYAPIMSDILIIEQIIAHLRQEHGNILHMAVYTRDLKIFNMNKSKELLKEKHDNMTPYELASHLNYTEFLGINDIKEAIFYEPAPTEKLLDHLDKNEPLNEKIIKMAYMRKYLNGFQGYATRLIKISLNFFFSESRKISVIDLRECIITREDDKIIMLHNDKEYKFKANSKEDLDQIYGLISDRKAREKMLDEVIKQEKGEEEKISKSETSIGNKNEYLYAFLIKILLTKIQSKELTDLFGRVKSIKNYLPKIVKKNDESQEEELLEVTCDSDESYYSSLEEEYFDIESPLYEFTIYRTSLPSKACSSLEPLSYLQRLTEQFQNINILKEQNDPLSLFERVIIYTISAFSMFRKRIRPCFEPFIGESFSLREKDYELYVEKSDKNTINLFYNNTYLTMMMTNNDVEIIFPNYLVQYAYNLKNLEHTLREPFNTLNQTVNIKMYQKKVSEDNSDENLKLMDSQKDDDEFYDCYDYSTIKKSKNNDNDFKTFFYKEVATTSLKKYNLLYETNLNYHNSLVTGSIYEEDTKLRIITGCWYKEITVKEVNSDKITASWENNLDVFDDYYFFNMYTLQLNVPGGNSRLDSRKREDIRAIEEGNVDSSRESYNILKNKERLMELEDKKITGTIFVKKSGKWVFNGYCKNEDSSFESSN